MDEKVRLAERQFMLSGNREDAVAYINLLRRNYGKQMPSSLHEKYPRICVVGNFVPRQANLNQLQWEFTRYSTKKTFLKRNSLEFKNAKEVENFSFYDAVEIAPKLERCRGGSPFAVATSIVDGDMYALTPAYILKLLSYFRSGILIGKFTITKSGGVQSLVMEK